VGEIHSRVPGYDTDLASKVDSFLRRLTTGALVGRRNFAIHELPDLFAPDVPPRLGVAPAEQWLRSERQTLRRLLANRSAMVGLGLLWLQTDQATWLWAALPRLSVIQFRWRLLSYVSLLGMVALGYAFVGLGTNQDSIAEGQKLFESGSRVEWRLR